MLSTSDKLLESMNAVVYLAEIQNVSKIGIIFTSRLSTYEWAKNVQPNQAVKALAKFLEN